MELTDGFRVPMPIEGADLRGFFDERVSSGSLDTVLDLSVAEFDELAQCAGITVTQVDTSGAGIAVHYAVSWTSFHACDDRTFGGVRARVLRGRIDGGDWLFERLVPLAIRRDTFDEF